DDDRDREQNGCAAVVARFGEREDGDRERARPAGNGAGHHDRRAELADGAREGEQRAGRDAAKRERQADREEHTPWRRAERLDERSSRKPPPRQQPREPDANRQDRDRRGRGHHQRERRDLPDVGHFGTTNPNRSNSARPGSLPRNATNRRPPSAFRPAVTTA